MWAHPTRTLTDPDSYKADVSALALEATLGTHDTDIKALFAALNDLAQSDILSDGTPFAGADIATILAESQSHPTLAEIEASTALALKAHLVHGTGGITPPSNKGIWDYLPYLTGDAYVRLGAPVGASISADIAAIKAEIDNATYGLSAIETLTDEVETLLKGSDESGSFTWDTSVYGTSETDISALFTTNLTGTTRRAYALYIDLTGPAGDTAAWTSCTIKVKVKIDGTNYRTIDKKALAKTDVAATAEPGVPIDIPLVAQDVQITMQFDVALNSDQTIYYHTVKQIRE